MLVIFKIMEFDFSENFNSYFICRPESASTQSFDIKVGDMVLLATDGVFDNLPDSLILGELVSVAGTTDSSLLQKAANAIAKKAQIMAFDEQYMSPFALSARKNGIDAVGKDVRV